MVAMASTMARLLRRRRRRSTLMPALLMAMFCALHDVEAKEKGEVIAMVDHGKALKAVHLDEPRAQVHLGHVGGGQE